MSDNEQPPFKFAGYIATIASSLLVSTSVLCLKLLPVEDSIQEKAKACMIRGILMSVFCGLSIIYRGESFLVPRGEYMINIGRAGLGGAATLFVYVALNSITMGECSALVYSSPVWTCLLSFIILREPLKASLLIAIPTSLLGIILLAHPDLLVDTRGQISLELEQQQQQQQVFALNKSSSSHDASLATNNSFSINGNCTINAMEGDVNNNHYADNDSSPEYYFQQRLPGILLSLISSFFMSVVFVILKFRRKTPIATCSFYLGVTTALIGVGMQLQLGFGSLPSSTLEWLLLWCLGLSSYISQNLFQWSLQFVNASTYSVMRSLDIVLGFVLGAVFLGDIVLWTSVAGSILIITVVILLMFDQYIEQFVGILFRRQAKDEVKSPAARESVE